MELSALLAEGDLHASEAQPVIAALIQQQKMVRLEQGGLCLLLTKSGWEHLSQKAVAIVQDYHQRFPTRSGMPKVALSSKLGRGTHSSVILPRLLDEGALVEEGLVVRLPAHQIQLTAAQQKQIDDFLQSLAQNPCAPPGGLIPERGTVLFLLLKS